MLRWDLIHFFLLITGLFNSACSSHSISTPSNTKPVVIVTPVAVLGIVSDVRKSILQKTLNDSVSKTFKVVPQERFESALKRAIQELDSDQCLEDQCILLIKKYLKVGHIFQLNVFSEGQVVELILNLMTLDEKKTKTDICKKCSTFELSQRVRILTEKILIGLDLTNSDMLFKQSEPQIIKKKHLLENKEKKNQQTQKNPKALTWLLNKEKIKPVASPTESSEKTAIDESNDIRVRALGGSTSSNKINVTSNSFLFNWNGYGGGISNIEYQNKSSSGTTKLSASTLELSYVFGDEWSIALGIGVLINGNGIITTTNGNYETSDASGMKYQTLLGLEWFGIDGLIGYQSINLKYKEFIKNSDGSTLSTPLSVSGGLLLFGFGVHF
jgi:hypothetical protein